VNRGAQHGYRAALRRGNLLRASASPLSEAMPLTGEHHCDVGIVGAGVSGCSTALHLAGRGLDVVLLEAGRVGHGASGRSGGQFIYGLARPMREVRAQFGSDTARALWRLSLDALQLARTLIAEHHISCDPHPGHLQAAVNARQLDQLRQWHAHLSGEYGYTDLALLAGSSLHAHVQTHHYAGGLYDPHSLHLHPLNYTLGLARAARQRGVHIHEHSPALRIEYGQQQRVHCTQGTLHCRQLVLCGGAWLGALEPALRAQIMPVGTWVIATEPLGEARARALIPSGTAVADLNYALDYYRLDADQRLLFGGRVGRDEHITAGIVAQLHRRLLRVFPQLADVALEYAWGGRVDLSATRLPQFARPAPNVYAVQGFSGHGMALAGLAGQLLAEAALGDLTRFDVFARLPRRQLPPQLLRWPLLALNLLQQRLRELL
jgi:gamma-glutamylputrescine oxidase